ncbi:MAG: hypothetical protein LBP56_03825 [Odoribacteraceae bacterium]|nr:hypothetical protein [Odoribacteraceae bacterium]
MSRKEPRAGEDTAPGLEAGTCTLEIVTRCTRDGVSPPKEPREISYNQPLKAG